ncbi:hypothetical protein [Acidipropionibacterium virtanenii]|nr:hypothetical protein [Acidipropionibacterium virtanenii]
MTLSSAGLRELAPEASGADAVPAPASDAFWHHLTSAAAVQDFG